ncbi:NYN domain-containing protein [Hydrogenophaga sp. D2P1]|uniref:NYN domain-containing protein n=1 Tax=Hydrogenophaga aromaticivorans TaxID=2610898 RepID=A0A7Y8L0I3_9BURK|nr:NYN domain-containing protein [Hydrogenophaga aromaticivorans]NWF48406.1 NYN domain-containing protein [Hydrogenophaga aromaticivorans]
MRVFLIDADNLSSPGWVDEAFKALETAEGSLAVRRAYGSAENLKGLAETLRTWAIRPFVNLSLSKNTTDIALAADAMAFACQQPAPAMIVIGSGDADFVPLVVRLRERGIQVVCVSEASKMAPEAVPAYDRVLYVGHAASARRPTPSPAPAAAPTKARRSAPAAAPAAKAAAKKVPAKKAVARKEVPAAPPAPKESARKTAAKPAAPADALTVPRILAAVPALEAGAWQPLGDVAKALRDGGLLGKSALSTKLFKKFPAHFELRPGRQPNEVRLVSSPASA